MRINRNIHGRNESLRADSLSLLSYPPNDPKQEFPQIANLDRINIRKKTKERNNCDTIL